MSNTYQQRGPHAVGRRFIRTAGRTLHRFGRAIGTLERLTERCVSRNVACLRGIRGRSERRTADDAALFRLCPERSRVV